MRQEGYLYFVFYTFKICALTEPVQCHYITKDMLRELFSLISAVFIGLLDMMDRDGKMEPHLEIVRLHILISFPLIFCVKLCN